MALQYSSFSQPVQAILTSLERVPFPLVHTPARDGGDLGELVIAQARDLFPSARLPEEARSGLLLRLNRWEESHEVSQSLKSVEGSYWHGIAHRMEPDYFNAGYWFRRVGKHPVHSDLHQLAGQVLASENLNGWRLKQQWDPDLFTTWCEEANQAPGSLKQKVARSIQMAEWELLFQWCGACF